MLAVQIALLTFGPQASLVSVLNVFNFSIQDSTSSLCVIPLTPLEHLTAGIFTPLICVLELFLIFGVHALAWLWAQKNDKPEFLVKRLRGQKMKKSPCNSAR